MFFSGKINITDIRSLHQDYGPTQHAMWYMKINPRVPFVLGDEKQPN
jgi:hypothetical protein